MFLVFLVGGIFAIVLPPTDSWISFPMSTSLVAIYSALLIQSQQKYHVAFSSTTKTSPYILGFLFTQITLLYTFLRSSSSSMTTDEYMSFAKWQMGAAIGTSVVGLVGRQILVTLDPGEQSASQIYEELLEQIKSHWATFADAQKGLIATITAFVATREDLFQKEESAATHYVHRLETVLKTLSATQASFDVVLTSLGATIGARTAALDTRFASLQTVISDRQQSLALTFTTYESAFSKHATNVVNECAAITRSLDTVLSNLGSRGEEAVLSFRGPLEETQRSIRSLSDEVGALSNHWHDVSEGISGASETLRNQLEHIRQSLQDASTHINSINTRLVAVLDTDLRQQSQMTLRVQHVLGDLQAFDAIVDQVKTVLTKRLKPDL